MLLLLATFSYFGANTKVGEQLLFEGKSTKASFEHASCKTEGEASGTLYCVTRVVDGDTIDLYMDGKSIRVRLLGINTPETVDPRRPVECFGEEASKKAKEILMGKYVSVEADPSQGEYDKYGRMLLYVYLPDGTFFNKMMIEVGYAHEYTYRYPYKYQQDFKVAERDARLHERGLWAAGACQTK